MDIYFDLPERTICPYHEPMGKRIKIWMLGFLCLCVVISIATLFTWPRGYDQQFKFLAGLRRVANRSQLIQDPLLGASSKSIQHIENYTFEGEFDDLNVRATKELSGKAISCKTFKFKGQPATTYCNFIDPGTRENVSLVIQNTEPKVTTVYITASRKAGLLDQAILWCQGLFGRQTRYPH